MIRPAICDALDRIIDERRGELRRLDLLARGIEVDLDQDQLVALGRAPDHEDILDQLQLPDYALAPIWEHWRQSRVLPNGYPAAIAGRGQVAGQAIIARARAEADRVREILVEVARLKITGQVPTDEEVLDLVDPEDRPMVEGLLERAAWYVQVLDHDQDPAPVQDQVPNPAHTEERIGQTAPERRTTESPKILDMGKTDTTDPGQADSAARVQPENQAGQT